MGIVDITPAFCMIVRLDTRTVQDFRNGMCHPFRPFNLQTGKAVDIIEIPQVIMDDSLFDTYMRLDPDHAWEINTRD